MVVDKLKIYNRLKRLKTFMQRGSELEAYACLLNIMDRLEEDLLYRDAKEDWQKMNKEFQHANDR